MDHLINTFDAGLQTIFSTPNAGRDNPAGTTSDEQLTITDKQTSAALMRINHTGEVCAQALYHGQLLLSRDDNIRALLQHSADEETDHLAWTAERLAELGTHQSYLNGVWYLGSFTIGALAGLAGDRWSLGFVTETERQVEAHLSSHLEQLPEQDQRSRKIVEQMRADEVEHGQSAADAGAATLPTPVKTLMSWQAKIMTTVVRWV